MKNTSLNPENPRDFCRSRFRVGHRPSPVISTGATRSGEISCPRRGDSRGSHSRPGRRSTGADRQRNRRPVAAGAGSIPPPRVVVGLVPSPSGLDFRREFRADARDRPLVISTGAGPKGRRSGEILTSTGTRFLRSALRAPVEMTGARQGKTAGRPFRRRSAPADRLSSHPYKPPDRRGVDHRRQDRAGAQPSRARARFVETGPRAPVRDSALSPMAGISLG